MCKSFLNLKTFYTIQELNSIFLGEQSQKRIFSLSKMLKSLSHFHSLSTRLCELEHEEISPLLKKSIKFDNLLCKILKRAKIIKLYQKRYDLGKNQNKSKKPYHLRMLEKIEKSINLYFSSCSSVNDEKKFNYLNQIKFEQQKLELPCISRSFFDLSDIMDNSTCLSEFSVLSSLQ